jgi:aspartate/methionine/tyrosine aminotransferase
MQMTTEIRQIILDELGGIADLVTVPRADGAFYFLLRVHKDSDPMELARQLIEEHKVAVIPGMTFGVEDKCYLRVAYGALQKDTAAEGIGRLVKGLKQILAT